MSESTKKKFYQTDGFRMFMGKYGIGVILIFMILARTSSFLFNRS